MQTAIVEDYKGKEHKNMKTALDYSRSFVTSVACILSSNAVYKIKVEDDLLKWKNAQLALFGNKDCNE